MAPSKDGAVTLAQTGPSSVTLPLRNGIAGKPRLSFSYGKARCGYVR